MNTGIWISRNSSPIVGEIRKSLYKSASVDEGPITSRQKKRLWREEYLGILSEAQKKEAVKARIERKNKKKPLPESTDE